jgi:hypothetical protein
MELRRVDRAPAAGKIRIHWHVDGLTFGSLGRVVDISEGGMCVDLDRRIPAGCVIQIESHEHKLAGLAVVRHCRQKGMGFRLGLQFSGGLKGPSPRQPESLAAAPH